jgi:group I intron endonuclease
MGDELMSIKNYTVYCHTNRITKKVYIGITKLKPERRWSNGKGYKESVCFNNAINKYGWENFIHEILFTNLTVYEAEKKERYLIKQWNTLSPNGYNLQSGGSVNRTFSSETILKMRASQSGKVLTEEHRKKISKSNIGKTPSPETLLKMSLANIGKKLSEETKAKISQSLKKSANIRIEKSSKEIIQLTLDDVIIRNWASASKASNEIGVCRTSVAKCCRNEQLTSGGFKWRFHNG